jgi:hypothetical protein
LLAAVVVLRVTVLAAAVLAVTENLLTLQVFHYLQITHVP